MRKRIGFVALAFLFALASTYARTTKLFALVSYGPPQEVQAAISNRGERKEEGGGGKGERGREVHGVLERKAGDYLSVGG